MGKRQLWVISGANGAGKSKFYTTRLKPCGVQWVNADQIARGLDPINPEAKSYQAAQIAANIRDDWIRLGRSFCYETVFSHISKLEFIIAAKARGYEIILVFIHLNSIKINLARVVARKEDGGHGVDPLKIEQRIPRTLRYVAAARDHVDEMLLFDNSSKDDPYILIAHKKADQIATFLDQLPDWAQSMLFGSNDLLQTSPSTLHIALCSG